ncbi:hypothetical protein ABW19_dt0201396 [Dactylella cylindrospora]|nr:hypothetical protein ABW19_dt0201396 [Dactylella cylindrospora]
MSVDTSSTGNRKYFVHLDIGAGSRTASDRTAQGSKRIHTGASTPGKPKSSQSEQPNGARFLASPLRKNNEVPRRSDFEQWKMETIDSDIGLLTLSPRCPPSPPEKGTNTLMLQAREAQPVSNQNVTMPSLVTPKASDRGKAKPSSTDFNTESKKNSSEALDKPPGAFNPKIEGQDDGYVTNRSNLARLCHIAYEKGCKDGIAKDRKKIREEGYRQGFKEGYKEGREQGWAEGHREGLAKGYMRGREYGDKKIEEEINEAIAELTSSPETILGEYLDTRKLTPKDIETGDDFTLTKNSVNGRSKDSKMSAKYPF